MTRVLDLFAGIGGFSLGLERAGFQTVGFCEIDPFAQAVLKKHWPDVPCHDDVETYDFQEGCADVITAGFPCQDISFAGAGAGLAGARSGLYRHVIRALRLVRPKFAILENVAALLSRGMGTVLGDMAEIGFDAEWHCIPASAVGAPHRRDRIWIIANPGSEQHEGGCAPISGALASELSQAYLAHTSCELRDGSGAIPKQGGWDEFAGGGKNVADALRFSVKGKFTSRADPQEWEISGERSARPCRDGLGWWAVEPDVGRVASGIPARVDRLRTLGNTVVPQVVETIGRAILASMEAA
jgi:DNA (cytosine-5)-methyltransferase 1